MDNGIGGTCLCRRIDRHPHKRSRSEIGNTECQDQKNRGEDRSFDCGSASRGSEKTAKCADHLCSLIKIWGGPSSDGGGSAANPVTGQTTIRESRGTAVIDVFRNNTETTGNHRIALNLESLLGQINEPRQR